MACNFDIIACGEDRAALTDIANLALDEVEQLDERFNCFNPRSEVSFLNAEAARRPVVVGPDLFEILSVAKQIWEETNGAFDVTAGPIVELWRTAEQTGRPPDRQAIEHALSKVGMDCVLLEERTNAVQFRTPGIRVNLGAIGKGYAAEKAASILREYGVESALVSAGGSTIRAFGNGPEGDGFKVGIRHPSKLDERVAELTLKDQAMSTSGGPAQRDRDIEERFEHIIDPRTGHPAESTAASVTVIAGDATISDALATAFYLHGKELADRYCRSHPGIEAVFVPKKAASPE